MQSITQEDVKEQVRLHIERSRKLNTNLQYFPIEQGTPEWFERRRGCPTASQMKRILTPTGKLSVNAAQYRAELLAEWALGVEAVAPDLSNIPAVERGLLLEPEARGAYEVLTDTKVHPSGVFFRQGVGASPDGLIGNPVKSLLEIKCPMPGTHLMWLSLGVVPPIHVLQLQAQLWVTQAPVVDFFSYCPGLPPLLVTVYPDHDLQDRMDVHLPPFLKELGEHRERLRALGVTPVPASLDTP